MRNNSKSIHFRISRLDYATVTDLSDSAFSIGSPNDVADTRVRPQQFALHQNYPNPFNPSTEIVFDLRVTRTVSLTVYNALREQLKTLVQQTRYAAGAYRVTLDAAGLSSGIYFYRLETSSGFAQTRKMLLLR
ncbi:MAG: T9SS type A sorting domain-containing protein [Bacteroidota bacterium]